MLPNLVYYSIEKNLFLGSVDKGVVEVTNCFCVPHKEHEDLVSLFLCVMLLVVIVVVVSIKFLFYPNILWYALL